MPSSPWLKSGVPLFIGGVPIFDDHCCCGCNCHCVGGIPRCGSGSPAVCPDGSVPTCDGEGNCICPGGAPGVCPCYGNTITVTLPSGLDAFVATPNGSGGYIAKCSEELVCAPDNHVVFLDGSVWTIDCTPAGSSCSSICDPAGAIAAIVANGKPFCCYSVAMSCSPNPNPTSITVNVTVNIYVVDDGTAYIVVSSTFGFVSGGSFTRGVAWAWKTSTFDPSDCTSLESAVWTYLGVCTFCFSNGSPCDNSACLAGVADPGSGFTIVVT